MIVMHLLPGSDSGLSWCLDSMCFVRALFVANDTPQLSHLNFAAFADDIAWTWDVETKFKISYGLMWCVLFQI